MSALNFQQLQQQLAHHLRDPQQAYDPQKHHGNAIEPRRLAIYESLFFNNFDSLLGSMFPVMQRLVGDTTWEALIRQFMQSYGAHTPYFHKLGQEWLQFLRTTDLEATRDWPFLTELAHYEWVELAVSIEPFEPSPFSGSRIDQDPVLQLSPLVWPLHYHWPVHAITTDSKAETIVPTDTWLLVSRDSEDKVTFAEITQPVFALLRGFVGAQQPVSQLVEQQVAQLSEQPDLNAEQVLESAAALIPQWLENQWLITTELTQPHPIQNSERLQFGSR